MDIFKSRIRELREENRLSLKELGDKIGSSDAAICKWENGITEPKSAYILKLANFFNVSTDYLLGRTDELGGQTILPSAAPALSQDEQQLLALFRKMSHPQKIRVIAYSEGLLSTHTGVQTPKNLA